MCCFKAVLGAVRAVLCAQAPAENSGMAVAMDCRVTAYSSLMGFERQGSKQVPDLTLPFAG